MKYIGLDVGNKRIGVAYTDELGMFAHPLYTIKRKGIERDIEEIKKIVKEQNTKTFVVGLPYNMDGTLGEQAQKTLKFAEIIKDALGLEIIFWDERLTTSEAREIMYLNNIKQADRKEIVDTIAAVVILDNYISSIRKV